MRGLEGALVDLDVLTLTALQADDVRALEAKVAGPAGLMVAKLHKIEERNGTARANDKDALDVLRLLRGVFTEELAQRMTRILADGRSADSAQRGLELLDALFGRGGEGAEMAARAVAGVMDADEILPSCEVLSGDLLSALEAGE